MIRLEHVKPGQILYGQVEMNVEGKKFRAQYTVVKVVVVDDKVEVINGRKESRLMDTRDLFTQASIERYWRGKYFTIYNLLKRMVNEATNTSPELKKELEEELL